MGAVPIPDGDHVARYCKPSAVGEDGLPMPAAFELRTGEEYLSVNWLELLDASDPDRSIARLLAVFAEKGYQLKKTGRFAALQVRNVKAAVIAIKGMGRVEHRPLDDDASHSGVFGYAADDFAVAVELAALVNPECVHLAIADQV